MFVEAHFQYIAYKSVVRAQVEYCLSVWDPHPGFENTGSYKIERIQHSAYRWRLRRYNNTSSITNMLEDLGWRTPEQRWTYSRLTALLKITRGSSLLSLTRFCALSCAGHVASIRRVSSRLKLACPLSIYPFSQEHLFSGRIYLLPSLANNAL